MIITILIPNASDADFEKARIVLQDAGFAGFEIHLQTVAQHAVHPLQSALVAPESPEDTRKETP